MIHARTPEGLKDLDRPLEDCIAACFPRSHALLEAERGLRQVWQTLQGQSRREAFAEESGRIDAFLTQPGVLAEYIAAERGRVGRKPSSAHSGWRP
jgi:hypothetical protein